MASAPALQARTCPQRTPSLQPALSQHSPRTFTRNPLSQWACTVDTQGGQAPTFPHFWALRSQGLYILWGQTDHESEALALSFPDKEAQSRWAQGLGGSLAEGDKP